MLHSLVVVLVGLAWAAFVSQLAAAHGRGWWWAGAALWLAGVLWLEWPAVRRFVVSGEWEDTDPPRQSRS